MNLPPPLPRSQKHRTSPSLERSRGKHRLRLVFLLLLTVVLTWYARQKRTNPFATQRSIVLSGTTRTGIIRFYLGTSTFGDTLVCLPVAVESDPCTLFLDSWSCLTLGHARVSGIHVSSPPRRWIVLGPADSIPTPPANWPAPIIQDHTGSPPLFALNRLTTTDGQSAPVYTGTYNNSSFIVIPRFDTCSPDWAPLKGKVDRLFVFNRSFEKVVDAANCLRPLRTFGPRTMKPDSETTARHLVVPAQFPCRYLLTGHGMHSKFTRVE